MVLLWLLPPVVVTLAAMVWVSWLARDGRGEVDRDEALRRLAGVLEPVSRRARRRERRRPGYAAPAVEADRSSGVAVRRSSRSVSRPAPAVAPAPRATGTGESAEPSPGQPGQPQRRAS